MVLPYNCIMVMYYRVVMTAARKRLKGLGHHTDSQVCCNHHHSDKQVCFQKFKFLNFKYHPTLTLLLAPQVL